MASKLTGVLKLLTTANLPPLPSGLSYEVTGIDQGQADLTGRIVESVKRTTGGLIEGLTDFAKAGVSIAAAPFTAGKSLVGLAPQLVSSFQSTSSPKVVGKVPMGFLDDIFGSDTLGDNFNQGLAPTSFDWTGLLNTGVQAAQQFFGSQNVPNQLQTQLGMMPAVVGTGVMVARTAGAALAARLASLGLNRATAWTLLKQQGPTALLALGLTAVEVAQLARSKGGYRRMNMCNGRALRRASRRLEGFHRFYKRTCGLPVHRKRSYKSCK